MKKTVLIVEDQFVEANYLRSMLEKAGYTVTGIARSVSMAKELIDKERPGLVLLDIFLSGKLTGVDLAKELKEENIAFIYLSANSNEDVLTAAKATQPYGFLVKPFREKDLLITLEIAQYRHEQSQDTKWRMEIQTQKELNSIQKMEGSWIQKLKTTAKALQHYVPFDVLAVKFRQLEHNHFAGFAFVRIGFEEYQSIGIPELSVITGLTAAEIKLLLQQTKDDESAGYYNGEDFKSLALIHPMKKLFAKQFDLASNLVFPSLSSGNNIFTLSFFRKIPEGYTSEKLDWLFRFQQSLAEIMNSVSAEEKDHIFATIETPNLALKEKAVNNQLNFDNIIGTSSSLLHVMDLINQVAASDTSVLILGESGTGKEKIADCIHNRSPRKGRPFIKVNCAALPSTLIESELFGHEKGAFTGATDKKIGKFEQANNGTIFLDEVGELPLDLQVKLLRVLQEKEIERVGAVATIKLNIRIIAATNRNLEKEVAAGKFRLDLYYRLNIFPILLPPLRERRDDIPALTAYFIDHFNRKSGKKITGIADKVAKKMATYNWPGNIRELEHLIERSVLLSKGTLIEDISLPEFNPKETDALTKENRIKTMEENERDHILAVLKQCKGKIWGPGAAAEILKIPPTTLKSKMDKLGIKKVFME
ncbi:sigma 54-interacting transcriptional regulator [Ferruginibacter profundus]